MNYKKSRLRERLLAIIDATGTHPTAQELFDVLREEHPGVGLASIYRNLRILVEQGRLTRVEIKGNSERFETRLDRHYHLICEDCGAVRDIPLEVDRDLDHRVEKVTGYSVSRHEIQFFGRCEKCR